MRPPKNVIGVRCQSAPDPCSQLLASPQAVQVAVFTSVKFTVCVDALKHGFGLFTRIEELPVHPAIDDKLNPLDVVLFDHGMNIAAHRYRDRVTALFNDGYMLFSGGIDRVFNL